MDLTTRYLGLTLPHPFMPGASPLVDNIDTVLKLEDAGAAAIVMHSLFEEQILRLRYGHAQVGGAPTDEFALGPQRYLEQVRRIKARVALPVIASLNGTTTEGWLEYARLIEQAGADALEINTYDVSTNPQDDARAVERRLMDVVALVKERVSIPVAVKLSPFYSSLPHLAAQLELIGVAGLVLFNPVHHADIDPENLQAVPRVELSTSADLSVRLQWLAILSGAVSGSLAVSGGVHEPLDAVKAVMAGADGVQLVSALLRNGPGYIGQIRSEFERWGDEHGHASIDTMRGSMSSKRGSNLSASQRGNYLRVLQSWQPADKAGARRL